MASSSKYIKLQQNVLLEWDFDSTNLVTEDYQILNDLKLGKRGYMSKTGLNIIEKTAFLIDPIIKKYALVDTTKYNNLKLESYHTSAVQFDRLRIHIPTSYSFVNNGYIGLYMRVYTYDYNNKKVVDLCSYLYDDTLISSSKDFVLNEEFYYDEQSWGKYLTFDIPSVDVVSKQRTSTINTNSPLSNSINSNLSTPNGISETSPIFIEFSYVVSRQDILGSVYYFMSDIFTKSISKVPEYLTLAANIQQASDGDYFEIFGTYGGDNESMDDFVDEVYSKGKKIKLEYEVSLYEENVLMSNQTFTVTENFTKKIWYRPILSFTNTTASIDVTMKVIDLVDNSQFDRLSSISLTKDVFKYGKKVTRIDLSGAWRPKIYNQKQTSIASESPNFERGDISLTSVNYPVISDRVDILVGASPSNDSSFKSMGLAEFIINRYGNVIRFTIASTVDDAGNVTPYNLTKITENSQLYLSFKSDNKSLDKPLWQETDQNDFENGVIIFRIEEQEVPTIKSIGLENKNFNLIVKSNKTGVSSLLYSGKWVDFDDVKFLENSTDSTSAGVSDFADGGISDKDLDALLSNNLNDSNVATLKNPNSNIMVFIEPDTKVKNFDIYLKGLGVNVYLRKPGGNSECLTYFYFILNVSPAVREDIKIQYGVSEVISLPFCIGADTTGTSTVNLQELQNSLKKFNCVNAERVATQDTRQNRPTTF